MSKIKDREGILQQQEKCSKFPTREIQLGYQLTSQQTCSGHREGQLAFKMLKGKKKKNDIQKCSTQKAYCSDLKENSKVSTTYKHGGRTNDKRKIIYIHKK